jgi:hypothetical protein
MSCYNLADLMYIHWLNFLNKLSQLFNMKYSHSHIFLYGLART